MVNLMKYGLVRLLGSISMMKSMRVNLMLMRIMLMFMLECMGMLKVFYGELCSDVWVVWEFVKVLM